MFWIVDNGSSHAGKASIRRLEVAWENLRLIHLPIHPHRPRHVLAKITEHEPKLRLAA